MTTLGLTDTSGPSVWQHSLASSTSHEILARACVQYLQLRVFEEEPLEVKDEFLFYNRHNHHYFLHPAEFPEVQHKITAYLKKHQFLEYAAGHWLKHYELCFATGTEEWAHSAIEICQIHLKAWRTWFAIYVSQGKDFISSPKFTTTLQFMAWFGFENGARELLQNHNFSCKEKLLPLAFALQRRHRNITELFRNMDFPKRSTHRRLRDIDKTLKLVEESFRDTAPELKALVDEHVM